MENSIFNIFGTQPSAHRANAIVSKTTTHWTINRGPLKPHVVGATPLKKAFGGAPSGVLCDVGNITARPQTSSNKGGAKKIKPLKDLQCNPGTSYNLQKSMPKKLKSVTKVEEVAKSLVGSVFVQMDSPKSDFCSLAHDELSCGMGSIIPKHLQLTVEDIDALGNLTSFRLEEPTCELPEIFPVDDFVEPGAFDEYICIPSVDFWKDLPPVPMPRDISPFE